MGGFTAETGGDPLRLKEGSSKRRECMPLQAARAFELSLEHERVRYPIGLNATDDLEAVRVAGRGLALLLRDEPCVEVTGVLIACDGRPVACVRFKKRTDTPPTFFVAWVAVHPWHAVDIRAKRADTTGRRQTDG